MINIEPKNVFHWFYQLNQIPRGSGDEKRVSDFLVEFAKDRNLEYVQDDQLNVIIRKPASKGYENSVPVILQGHMDMVCVKDSDSNHDFNNDPIEMYTEDGFLKAKGTTLGGDDGIAVAYALAILDGEYEHPALEALFTTSEETGLHGAKAIKEGMLKGKRLINIDSEEEGIILVSCSGGSTISAEFKLQREDFKGENLSFEISGLKGGHSGQVIKEQRGNSNKMAIRILNEIRKEMDLRIVSIKGGIKTNAISNETKATVLVENNKKACEIVKDMADKIKSEYKVEEPNLKIEIINDHENKTPFTKELSYGIIDYLMAIPDGVIGMSKDIEGLVETSMNNAILGEDEKDGIFYIKSSVRSSVESKLDMVLDIAEILCKNANGTLRHVSRYPAWQFEKDSKLRDIAMDTYKELFNKEATYTAIHAGLECGILKKVIPGCDAISFGPNMYDVHSPKEKLDIESSARMFDFTVGLLKNLK